MAFDFIGKRYLYIIFSLLITVPGFLSLAAFGLKAGIEFTSGSLMTLHIEPTPEQAAVRDALSQAGHGDAIVQRNSEGDYIVRTRTLTPEVRDAAGQVTVAGERSKLIDTLTARLGTVQVLSFDEVSAIVANEIGQRAALAVAVSSIVILMYIKIGRAHV